jgi:phage gpG-like protein
MIFVIRAMGIKQVQTKFTRMGEAAIAAQPALYSVADLMMGFIDRTFASEGRRGGGSWKQLTTDWLMRKTREGMDPRIGQATQALRRAFTQRGDSHQILEVTNTRINLTTDLPYAGTQQRHRPFIKLTTTDRSAMRGVVRDYLVAAWRAG